MMGAAGARYGGLGGRMVGAIGARHGGQGGRMVGAVLEGPPLPSSTGEGVGSCLNRVCAGSHKTGGSGMTSGCLAPCSDTGCSNRRCAGGQRRRVAAHGLPTTSLLLQPFEPVAGVVPDVFADGSEHLRRADDPVVEARLPYR